MTTCFTQLEVWKAAHQQVLEVYRLVRTFPREERYELCPQMRRAAVSIAANIGEGYGRRSPADKARLYGMSRGSAEELRYYFLLVRDLGYAVDSDPRMAALDSICRMLRRLVDRTLERA
jgi:four helix bundle protein